MSSYTCRIVHVGVSVMVERSESAAVLVTGAAGGIGLATTKTLIQRGYPVYAGVHTAGAELTGIPGVEVLELDVTSTDSVRAAAKEVAAREGSAGLRAVVNNAGVIVQGPLELVPPDELYRQFAHRPPGRAVQRPDLGQQISVGISVARGPGRAGSVGHPGRHRRSRRHRHRYFRESRRGRRNRA